MPINGRLELNERGSQQKTGRRTLRTKNPDTQYTQLYHSKEEKDHQARGTERNTKKNGTEQSKWNTDRPTVHKKDRPDGRMDGLCPRNWPQ